MASLMSCRLPCCQISFAPHRLCLLNLTAYFHKITTIIERLEQNDGGITVPDIRLFRYQLAFFLSSDLDETFKYCTLHYINNLLVGFINFKGNRVDASIRGDSEISEIMEHDLARRTYDRPKVLSPKMGLGGLKSSHFVCSYLDTWKMLPGGRSEMRPPNFGGGLITAKITKI